MIVPVYNLTLFREVISQSGVSLDPRKVQALMTMSPPKCEKELQSIT